MKIPVLASAHPRRHCIGNSRRVSQYPGGLAYRPGLPTGCWIVEIPLEQGRNGDGASSTIEHLARVLPDAAILVTGPIQSAHLVIQVMRAAHSISSLVR